MPRSIPPTGNRPLGHLTVYGEGGVVFECDTFTCQHCNQTKQVQPFKSAEASGSGAICHGCGGLICMGCIKEAWNDPNPKCDYIERKLERVEAGGQWWREFQSMRG